MNMQKFALATLIGTIVSFIAAYLIFGIALHSWVDENTMEGTGKDMPDFLWVSIGHMGFSIAVAFIFMNWAGINNLKDGLVAGLIIGTFISIGDVMIDYGTTNMFTGGPSTAFMYVAADALIWAAGGAGVGWALGLGKGVGNG